MDKLPPQATEIEEVLLGALLLESNAIDKIRQVLKPEMFYNEKHRKVYEVLCDMHRQGKEIDLLTVKQNSNIEASFLASLTRNVCSAAHIKEHAAIIYEKWLARELIQAGSEMIERSYTDDVHQIISDANKNIEGKLLSLLGLNSCGIKIQESANKSIDEYYKREAMINEGVRSGIPTPFNALDGYTAGWQKEQLIVLAARPGMGKTSLAISFLMSAARHKKRVAMYSLEMSATRLSDKIICSIASIDFSQYKNGTLPEEDRTSAEAALEELNSWDVTFNDNLLTDMDQMRASASAIKNKGGIDLIIIDYLQLMRGTEKFSNREREVAENSRKAKMMAVELGCPVILLSQLNRSLEARGDKRPMLSDLRESGAIEQDADIVLFVYRDAVYNAEADSSIGELIIAKHREGPTGSLEFKCNESLTRFSDIKKPLPF